MRKAIMSILLGLSLISLIQPVKANTDTIITQEQRTTLDKYGYKIVIKDEIEDKGWGFKVAGYFSTKDKAIYLKSSRVNYAFYHEYGHFIDHIKNDISSTDKFREIFNQEKEKLFENEFYRNDITEYFAESYQMYLQKPDYLKDKAPLTYDYIEKIQKIKF